MKTWREISHVNYSLDLRPFVDLTPVEFEEICRRNPDVSLELAPDGRLVIVPPAGSDGGRRNSKLSAQIWLWAEANGGEAFDSSTGFRLPNGAVRSPDSAWMTTAKWEALTPAQRRTFAPVCPDFVAELRSPSDNPRELRAKMAEYLECGARLAWLLDPEDQSVEIYRPGRPVERLQNPRQLSGGDVMSGLVIDLEKIL